MQASLALYSLSEEVMEPKRSRRVDGAGTTIADLRAVLRILIKEQRKVTNRAARLFKFTRQQLKVLRTVVHRSDRKLSVIATDYLHIHPRTLDGHLNRIYGILGVHTRAGMTREAVRLGLV